MAIPIYVNQSPNIALMWPLKLTIGFLIQFFFCTHAPNFLKFTTNQDDSHFQLNQFSLTNKMI
jgi:hypothetical protein